MAAVEALPGAWWAERLLARLEPLGVAFPVGQVYGLQIVAGSVTAQVQAPDGSVYEVWIELPALSGPEWARAERMLAADLTRCIQVLDGEFPADLEVLFNAAGLALVPARAGEIALECSCPEWRPVCGHLGAVLHRLAAEIAADPFVLSTWRGRTRGRLLKHLQELRGAKLVPAVPRRARSSAERPPADCLEDYWLGEIPGSVPPPGSGSRPSASDLPLHRLAPPTITVRGRNLAVLLGPAYEALTS